MVADEHPGHGDEPYTLQFGGCQAHGEYIHLTPDYVVNDDHVASWGPKGSFYFVVFLIKLSIEYVKHIV